MTASLGASLLVILTFFIALSTLLMLAVYMESTLNRPRPRRVRISIRGGHAGQQRSVR